MFAGGRVNGRKLFVPQAFGATGFIVTTQAGPVHVDRTASGLSLDAVKLQDGGHSATLMLDDTPGTLLAGMPVPRCTMPPSQPLRCCWG